MVDGKIETDPGRGVGLMDVLTIGDDNYRCILDTNGKLRYRPITKKSADSKICRITGKSTIKGGITQLHLHDGRNILLESDSVYKTGDSIVISLPIRKSKATYQSKKVLWHISLAEVTSEKQPKFVKQL